MREKWSAAEGQAGLLGLLSVLVPVKRADNSRHELIVEWIACTCREMAVLSRVVYSRARSSKITPGCRS